MFSFCGFRVSRDAYGWVLCCRIRRLLLRTVRSLRLTPQEQDGEGIVDIKFMLCLLCRVTASFSCRSDDFGSDFLLFLNVRSEACFVF